MTWTDDGLKQVGNALLSSWPGTVTAWGKEGFSAYIGELQARRLTAEAVVSAIRAWPAGSDFPPSAPNLAAAARKDPSKPTFDETLTLIRSALSAYNLPLAGDYTTEVQMIRARERKVYDRAETMHPLVAAFIDRHGVARLQDEVADIAGNYGAVRRKELEVAWDQHCDALEGREIAALATGRRGGDLAQLDPLAALHISPPKQIEERV